MNLVLSGALTGGFVNLRGGWKFVARGSISGGLLLGLI